MTGGGDKELEGDMVCDGASSSTRGETEGIVLAGLKDIADDHHGAFK